MASNLNGRSADWAGCVEFEPFEETRIVEPMITGCTNPIQLGFFQTNRTGVVHHHGRTAAHRFDRTVLGRSRRDGGGVDLPPSVDRRLYETPEPEHPEEDTNGQLMVHDQRHVGEQKEEDREKQRHDVLFAQVYK